MESPSYCVEDAVTHSGALDGSKVENSVIRL
jgi:hypothetical protein